MEAYLRMKSVALMHKTTLNLQNILWEHKMEFNLFPNNSLDEQDFKLLIMAMKMMIEVINTLNNFAKSIDAYLNLLRLFDANSYLYFVRNFRTIFNIRKIPDVK
jgi:hypothetical protein